jgi:hypothetical protein
MTMMGSVRLAAVADDPGCKIDDFPARATG